MATAGGGDSSIYDARESTPLVPEVAAVVGASNLQESGCYQSLHQVDAASLSGEFDHNRLNVIGPPQPNEFSESSPQVVIENKTDEEKDAITDLQCLMNILKGNLGTGVLALPSALSHAGLWMGMSGILFIGLVATHCMHLLIQSSRILLARMHRSSLSYADVMESSLITGPFKLRPLAIHARRLVNFMLLFTQIGFCCVYIVFIATNVKEVVDSFTSVNLSLRVYEVMVTVLLMPYCAVRNLSTLTPFCLFANILTLIGMVLIFLNICSGLPDFTERPGFTSVADLPLFFGTAIFAFEGISLVLPLEATIRDKKLFSSWYGVVNLSMVTVTCLYSGMAFFGYLKYGDDVKGSITLNLPSSPWYFLIVKPMFAISIYLSYNVQLYVPIRIVMGFFERRYHLEELPQKRKRMELGLRMSALIVTMAAAMAIPHLDLLISLIGAMASSSLAMILPVTIHLLTFSQENDGNSKIVIIKGIFIVLLGILGFVTGTYSSLRDIANTF